MKMPMANWFFWGLVFWLLIFDLMLLLAPIA